MVRRVNWSPAREPKGLDPPAPPKAPINPPPLPRWIKISKIMNAPSGSRMKFSPTDSISHMAANSLGDPETRLREIIIEVGRRRGKPTLPNTPERMGRRRGENSPCWNTSPQRKRGGAGSYPARALGGGYE